MKNKRKKLIALLSAGVLACLVVATSQNAFAFAEDGAPSVSTEVVVGEGVKVALIPEKGSSQVTFDYWNYVDINELVGGSLLKLKMTPNDIHTAEADSLVVTVRDVIDSTQCLSIVVNVSNAWYDIYSTYGRAALIDDLNVGNWVTIKGTDQSVVGMSELVYGNADSEQNYTAQGSLDVGKWGSKYGVFAANPEAKEEDSDSKINPLYIGYADHVVTAGSATLYGNGNVRMRTIANLNSDAYLKKSTNKLSDSEEHKAIKNLYTHEWVENLFSSGKVTLSFTFGGVKESGVSFCLEEVGGVAVENTDDTSAPVVKSNVTTEALKGFSYVLPTVDIFENSDEKVENYDLRVTSPSGEAVTVSGDRFQANEVGEYTLAYSVKDNKNNTAEYEYVVTCYASLPSVSFKEISENGLQDSYELKSYVTLPTVCAQSALSRKEDGSLATSALVYKDGKSVQTFTDATQENLFEVNESGDYEIVYIAENEYGISVSKSLYAFTVADAPVVLADVTPVHAQYGSTYTIPEEYCFYKGAKYLTDLTITAPNGATEKANGAIVLSQFGEYVFTYSYEVGGMRAEKTRKVVSVDKASALVSSEFDCKTQDDFTLPVWAKDSGESGLLVSFNGEGSFRYKNYIELSKLNKNTPLIKLLPYNDEGSEYGKFTLKITLTDSENSSQRVVITTQPHGAMYQYAYTNVNYDGRSLAFSTETGGIMSSSMFGCLISASLGCGFGHTNVPQFMLSYDLLENSVYTNTNFANDPWKLLDFDDASFVGAGNEWRGFDSGKVFLTVEFTNLNAAKAGAIITEIAGQTLCGKRIEDNQAPNLYFQTEENFVSQSTLPRAEKNKVYRLPQAKGYDLVDGEVEVEYQLFREDDLQTNLYHSAAHIFEKSGKYLYTVCTKDKTGNNATKSFTIEVVDKVEKITVRLDDFDENITAGSWFKLPEILVFGGSGTLKITQKIALNGALLAVGNLNEVFLSASGNLTIEVSVQDYLATEIEGESVFTIPVAPSKAPVLETGGEPKFVFAGQKLTFGEFRAYLYGENGRTEVPYQGIFVDDVLVWSRVNGTETGALSYAFEKTSGTLVVRFAAGESASSVQTEKTVEVEIRNMQYVTDLLKAYNYDNSCQNTTWTVKREPTGARFTTTGNIGFQLVNGATADGFVFKLGGTTKEEFKNQQFRFILTDYEDDRVSVRFTLKMDGNSCYMYLGEKAVLLKGKLNDINQTTYFEYSAASLGFLDNSGNLLTAIATTDRGEKFEGFTSGGIRVQTEVVAPSGCDFVLQTLGNTSFVSAEVEDGEEEEDYYDIVGPAIGFLGEIRSNVYTLGEQITVPKAVAFDMATGKTDVTVTIRDGAANTIAGFNKAKANEERTLILSSYGTYVVTYTAKDGNGRSTTRTFLMKVVDSEPPVITVEGSVPTTLKRGGKITIPKFTVTDNESKTTAFVLLYLPDGSVQDVSGEKSFKTKQVGKHRLQIYCHDEEGNVSQVVFEIDVKGE